MKTIRISLAILAILSLQVGCSSLTYRGVIGNEDKPSPFYPSVTGLHEDLSRGPEVPLGGGWLLVIPCMAIEVPLSVGLDTVLLPVDLAMYVADEMSQNNGFPPEQRSAACKGASHCNCGANRR